MILHSFREELAKKRSSTATLARKMREKGRPKRNRK
jgi:hypothetical protein